MKKETPSGEAKDLTPKQIQPSYQSLMKRLQALYDMYEHWHTFHPSARSELQYIAQLCRVLETDLARLKSTKQGATEIEAEVINTSKSS